MHRKIKSNSLNIKQRDVLSRKLPKLRTLSLKGNPVTKYKEFDGYVAAFLPKLMYYEFKMVDERMRKLHSEKNQGEIFKVLGKEQREEMKIQQSEQQQNTEKMERAAFVNTLKGPDLLSMMFNVYVSKEDILLKLPQSKGTRQSLTVDQSQFWSPVSHFEIFLYTIIDSEEQRFVGNSNNAFTVGNEPRALQPTVNAL